MIWILTVAQLAQLAELWTGQRVFATRGLCEAFSLQYPEDMRPREGEALLNSALRAHGYRLVNQGRSLRIEQVGERSLPCRPRYADRRTKLVRVRAGELEEARRDTAAMLSEDGTLDVVENALVVSDHADVIRELEGWIGD